MENFFTELIERDLLKLREELAAFKNEEHLWATLPGVTNSVGNLSLHLIGNLNHFIGATLGQTGYVRQRDMEFSTRGVSREHIIAEIDKVRDMVGRVLGGLAPDVLEAQYPFEIFGQRSTGFYLTHFYGHLTYHLGQINYLRRILEG